MEQRPGVIRLQGVSAGYHGQPVLHDINLELHLGELCALSGPNGCGKSTLLKCLTGFLPIDSGDLRIWDVPVERWKPKALAQKIALIPQDVNYQFDFTVEDIVLTGQFPYLRFGHDYDEQQRAKAESALHAFDLWEMRRKVISRLSGGERQRVHLARAWAQDTPVILMDETFANLDINHQVEAMRRLFALNRDGQRLILVVSHNINLVAEYCNRVVLMRMGRIIDDGTPEAVITEETFRELYGVEIIRVTHPVSGKPYLLYPGNPR